MKNDIFDRYAIEGIFLNPNVTSVFIDAIMKKIPETLPLRFLLGVALCPAATPDQLRSVWAMQKTRDFRLNLAKNSSTPEELLEELFEIAITDDEYLLEELLENPAIPKYRFEFFLQKTYSDLSDKFWERLARNPSLNEDEQILLAKKIPSPEYLYSNPSLSKKAFDYMWEKNLWLTNFFETHLCSLEQLLQAANSVLEDSCENSKPGKVLSDPRCPSQHVLMGRSIDNYWAWKNPNHEIDWTAVIADEDMPYALAGRTDFPPELAMAVAVRTIFDDPEDPYSKYNDSAKWELAANFWIDGSVAEELYRRNITTVLENPQTPASLLIEAINDASSESPDRGRALRNPRICVQQISDLLEVYFPSQPPLTEKPDSSASVKCGFYRLQQRLREEGWYIEWTSAQQLAHAWEDKPFYHPEGPFQGIKINEEKCLVCCIGEPTDLLTPPEDLLDEEIDQWYEDAYEKLKNDDIEGLAEMTGQEIVNQIFDCSPEAWGENLFMFDRDGIDNLRAVLPLFEACGCRYGEIREGTITIKWDKIKKSNNQNSELP